MSRPLDGTGVVVTRPSHQADGLVRALEGAGAGVWRFPTLEIAAEPDDDTRLQAAHQAASADWLVFVSQNAVEHGLPRIRAAGGPAGHARCATVGRGTAEALRRNGVDEVLYPRHGATSEDLLAETELGRINSGRVMIVRGVGGRPHLAETLRARGAEVGFLEVYRRIRPSADPAPLLAAAEADQIQVVIATSGEVLDNFLGLVGDRGRRWLARSGVVVIGERVGAMASPHAGHVEIAATAAEEELTAATARAARAVAEIRSRRR